MFFLLLRRRRFTYGHPTRPVVGIWKHRVESGRQGMTAVVAAAARAPTFWSHWTFFSCCRCPSFHFLVFLCSNWPARERERRRRTGKREHFRRQVVARKGRCLHINAMQKGQPASTTTSSPLSPFMECKCAKWSRRRSSSRNQTSETGTEKERKKERDIGKRWIATLWPGLSDLIPTHLVSLRFGLDSIHGCIPVRPYGSLFFFYLTKWNPFLLASWNKDAYWEWIFPVLQNRFYFIFSIEFDLKRSVAIENDAGI